MKTKIILLVFIFAAGVFAIMLPGMLTLNSQKRELAKAQSQEQKQSSYVKELESAPDMIEVPELSQGQMEAESYNKQQMYFEGIEKLYDYLKFNQVEYIKKKVQDYVHLYISENILDCYVISDSIRQENGIIYFSLNMETVKAFDVQVTKDIEDNIADITITHTLKSQ